MTNTDHKISPALVALESAYAELQAEHGLPPAVIVIASGERGRQKYHGYFHAEQYAPIDAQESKDRTHEILIAAESFKREAHETFGTLVHEAAHAYCRANDIQDTSRGGRYHNKRFKKAAEDMGLTIGYDSRIGHSPTTVPMETREKYAHLIDAIEQSAHVFRDTAPAVAKPKSRTNVKLECECGIIIRASKKVADSALIRCDDCGELFTETDH